MSTSVAYAVNIIANDEGTNLKSHRLISTRGLSLCRRSLVNLELFLVFAGFFPPSIKSVSSLCGLQASPGDRPGGRCLCHSATSLSVSALPASHCVPLRHRVISRSSKFYHISVLITLVHSLSSGGTLSFRKVQRGFFYILFWIVSSCATHSTVIDDLIGCRTFENNMTMTSQTQCQLVQSHKEANKYVASSWLTAASWCFCV